MKTLNQRTTLILALAGAAVVAATAVFTPGCTCGPRVGDQTTKVDHLSYHGWTNALRLTSDQAEVIVVPEIDRVMSFRLRDGENVFFLL